MPKPVATEMADMWRDRSGRDEEEEEQERRIEEFLRDLKRKRVEEGSGFSSPSAPKKPPPGSGGPSDGPSGGMGGGIAA